MTRQVIRADRLGKKYLIRQRLPGRYRTLREDLAESARALTRRIRAPRVAAPGRQVFWALRDISFTVAAGDRVGIIGRNGAGKSTLLKILSRITEPSSGEFGLRGRVASLLEVGTGFHHELSGRENIYLNGAILGMRRQELKRKFDEIVAFAEVERFLDTPVKRYSTGMYVRLAFSVAAHLEPDILIVDEVLAVGDVAFQKKCLGRMEVAAREGRTVVFVSHNMTALQSLCSQAIWLDGGRLIEHGTTAAVIAGYLKTNFNEQTERVWDRRDTAPGNDMARLRRAAVRREDDNGTGPATVRTPLLLEFDYWNLQTEANLVLSIQLFNEHNVLVFDSGRLVEPEWQKDEVPTGLFRDTCRVPGDLLNNGAFRVDLFVSRNQHVVFHCSEILNFEVEDSAELRGDWFGDWPGVIRPVLDWTTRRLDHGSADGSTS